jgi:hypothetical protein
MFNYRILPTLACVKEFFMGYRIVAPGLLVSDRFKIEMPLPDPCWVIANTTGVAAATPSGKLLGFSTETLLKSFMQTAGVSTDKFSPKRFSWNDMVDAFASLGYTGVIIDHKGVEGFYAVVPLKKNI